MLRIANGSSCDIQQLIINCAGNSSKVENLKKDSIINKEVIGKAYTTIELEITYSNGKEFKKYLEDIPFRTINRELQVVIEDNGKLITR